MRRIFITLLGATLLALAAGCGGADFEGGTPEQQIRDLLADFAAALEDGDPQAACVLASPDTLEQLGGVQSCEEAVSRSIEDLSPSQIEELTQPASIEVEADEALIRYEGRPAGTAQLVGKEWLIGPDP